MAAYGVDRAPSVTSYLPADGSIPLLTDWDVGSFEVRAKTFESDAVTGTAPFTVASTTLVTNLNVGYVDGYTATTLAAECADHGNLTGRGDDDHTIYALVNGTRAFTGDISVTTAAPVMTFVSSSGDGGIEFCETDGDKRVGIFHASGDLVWARYDASGTYQSAAFKFSGSTGDLTLQPDSGSITVGGSTTGDYICLYEPSGDGSSYTGFNAQAQGADITYTLPNADGNSSDFLSTDGSGTLSWISSVPTSYVSAAAALSGLSSYTFSGLAGTNIIQVLTADIGQGGTEHTRVALRVSTTEYRSYSYGQVSYDDSASNYGNVSAGVSYLAVPYYPYGQASDNCNVTYTYYPTHKVSSKRWGNFAVIGSNETMRTVGYHIGEMYDDSETSEPDNVYLYLYTGTWSASSTATLQLTRVVDA